MDWWHLVPPMLALFSSGTLAWGAWLLSRERRARRDHAQHGLRTTGRVIDVVTEPIGLTDVLEIGYPVVHFIDDLGRDREFRDSEGYRPWPDIGQPVRIWYDPEDDATTPVVISGYPSLVATVLVAAGGFGVACSIGIVLLFGALR